MYQLFGSVRSRAFRVRWALEELGVPYDFIEAAPHDPQVRALSPLGRIPILVAEGHPITDSTAILTFLADRHGALTHPAGSLARADQDAITGFVLDDLDGVLWTMSKHRMVLPEALRSATVMPAAEWELARAFGRLEAMLGEGPFLTGASLTIPDIIAAHCCGWAMGQKIALASDPLKAWLDNLRARPAYNAARA